jgi:hypothetical protein
VKIALDTLSAMVAQPMRRLLGELQSVRPLVSADVDAVAQLSSPSITAICERYGATRHEELAATVLAAMALRREVTR